MTLLYSIVGTNGKSTIGIPGCHPLVMRDGLSDDFKALNVSGESS